MEKKFYTVKKKTYYFDQSGEMTTGWMKKKGEYFYMDRTSGVMKSKCTVDGIESKGHAEKSKDKRIILRKYKFLGWER